MKADPSDITIARAERKIEKELSQLGVYGNTDLSTFTVGSRQQIDELIKLRDQLKARVSPEAQIALYGEPRWNEHFRSFSDLQSAPATLKEGTALHERIWCAIPNCAWKRFQEAFCTAEDRIVPHGILTNGHVSEFYFPNGARIKVEDKVRLREEFEKLSVLPCIVSIDRVRQGLLQSLKIADFKDESDEIKRLVRKSDPSVILTLKLLFDSAQPVEPGSFRILKIAEPALALRSAYPEGIAGPDGSILGGILVVREAVGKNHRLQYEDGRWPHRLTVQFYPDPHRALRSRLHINSQYFEETCKVNVIRADLNHIHRRLNQEWRAASKEEREELLVQAQTTLKQTCEVLATVSDANKSRAKELFTLAQEPKDRLGRLSVSKVMSQMKAGEAQLGIRLAQIRSKNSYIAGRDQLAIADVLSMAEETIRLFDRRVVRAERLLTPQSRAFHPALPVKDQGKVAASLLRSVDLDPKTLGSVTVRPHRLFIDKLGEPYHEFVEAVQQKDLKKAQHSVVKMHIIAKFHEVYATFEELKRDPILKGDISFTELRDKARKLWRLYEPRQIFKDLDIAKGYQDPFYELKERLLTIGLNLSDKATNEPQGEERKAKLEEFRKYVKEVDVLTYLKRLHSAPDN